MKEIHESGWGTKMPCDHRMLQKLEMWSRAGHVEL